MMRKVTRWTLLDPHAGGAPWRWLSLCAAVAVTPGAAWAGGDAACFAASEGAADPLAQPIELRDTDHAVYGERPDGTDWAATRAVVDLPAEVVLAKLRDHRNFKDMKRTKLASRSIESPEYFDLRHVDVDVTIKKAFIELHVRWTEEWAYQVVEGTPQAPRVVVANYQKIDGTHHIEHQCGSYVVRRLGPDSSDVFLYDEIRAERRSAEDTSRMHRGILNNIREDRWPVEPVRAEVRVAQEYR